MEATVKNLEIMGSYYGDNTDIAKMPELPLSEVLPLLHRYLTDEYSEVYAAYELNGYDYVVYVMSEEVADESDLPTIRKEKRR